MGDERKEDEVIKAFLKERGRRGGQAKTAAKRAASANNGKRGGRPQKWTAARQWMKEHPMVPSNAADWLTLAATLVSSTLPDDQVHFVMGTMATRAQRKGRRA